MGPDGKEAILVSTITPKRKFSPEDNSPTCRFRKLSTSMQSSPDLRPYLISTHGHQETNSIKEGTAPDLLKGIGRLQLRPGKPTQNNNDGRAVNSSQNNNDGRAVNPAQRIIRRAVRSRTSSLGSNLPNQEIPRRRRIASENHMRNQRLITELLGNESKDGIATEEITNNSTSLEDITADCEEEGIN